MKATHLMMAFTALVLLAGCAAIDPVEQKTLLQHNVSPGVYDKMVRGDILTLNDVIELSQRQVPSCLIIRYLDCTYAVYTLDKQAITRLKKGKVCQEVIDYLLQTPTRFGSLPYDGRPRDPEYPVYPYRQAPPPPPPAVVIGVPPFGIAVHPD